MKRWGWALACTLLVMSVAVPLGCNAILRGQWLDSLGGPPFEPASVTFVSDDEGWLSGSDGKCGTKCDKLFRTVDGGRSWQQVRMPTFDREWLGIADARNWFALRRPEDFYARGLELWSSHDGGGQWSRVRLPEDVELPKFGTQAVITDGTVRVVAFGGWTGKVQMISGPVGADDLTATPSFQVVDGPGWDSSVSVGFDVVQAGSTSWFVGWISSTGRAQSTPVAARVVDGRWSSFPLPCVNLNQPELAAISATELAISCDPTGVADYRRGEFHLYSSIDAGDTFTDLGALAPRGREAKLIGAVTSQDFVVVSSTADRDNSLVVRTSHDGGRTWTQTLNPRTPHGMTVSGGLGQGKFFTRTTGYVRLSYVGEAPDGEDHLYLTHDGGNTWDRVTLD